MSQTAENTRERKSKRNLGALVRNLVGARPYDDRVDTQSNISTLEVLAIIARSFKQLAPVKVLFASKVALAIFMMIPGLLLPQIAKIVVDNAVLQLPLGSWKVEFPPFMDPILTLLADKSPIEIMLTISIIFVAMLFLTGARIKGMSSQLLEGEDAATQAENSISQGGSAGSGLLGLVEFMVNVRLTQNLGNNLRLRLFDRLARLPMNVLDDQRTGDSIYRVLYDVPMAPDLIYRLTTVPLLMLLGAGVNLYILQYSYGQVAPQLIWIAWITFPIAFLITFPAAGALRRTNQNKRAAGAAATNAMEESVNSIAAVQSLGAGKSESERFADRSSESFLRERFTIAVVGAVGLVAQGVLGIAAIYVTVLFSNAVIDQQMTAGDFFVLIGVYYGIVIPAAFFGSYWIKLQEVIAAVRRVFFFLDYESEEERMVGLPQHEIQNRIELKNVHYTYPNGTKALEAIDLEFSIGQFVAIVGPTGSGKTTLAYLIPGLLSPTSGEVLLDGTNASEVNVARVREHVSYVFQEHVFLPTTIRDNLLIANPNASDDQMMSALETAGCMEFIDDLQAGIETRLGRGGDTLSVGQQQRLSIARGMLREAKVLILDEPTSALDPVTEDLLVESLKVASRDRLVIVIAHRLSTIRNADRIFFLEEGQVRESGTHQELMDRPDGSYREFVSLQSN